MNFGNHTFEIFRLLSKLYLSPEKEPHVLRILQDTHKKSV